MTFRELFSKYNLSDDEIRKYAADLSGAMIVRCMKDSENVLSSTEQEKFASLINEYNISGALELMRSKYSEPQWDNLLKENAESVLGSYVEKVIKKSGGLVDGN